MTNREELLRQIDWLDAVIAEMRRMKAEIDGVLTCAECGRPWLDPADRWRAFLTVDDHTAFYCSECAEREFSE